MRKHPPVTGGHRGMQFFCQIRQAETDKLDVLHVAELEELFPVAVQDVYKRQILHGTDLNDINDKLFSENEKTLL